MSTLVRAIFGNRLFRQETDRHTERETSLCSRGRYYNHLSILYRSAVAQAFVNCVTTHSPPLILQRFMQLPNFSVATMRARLLAEQRLNGGDLMLYYYSVVEVHLAHYTIGVCRPQQRVQENSRVQVILKIEQVRRCSFTYFSCNSTTEKQKKLRGNSTERVCTPKRDRPVVCDRPTDLPTFAKCEFVYLSYEKLRNEIESFRRPK